MVYLAPYGARELKMFWADSIMICRAPHVGRVS